MIWKPAFNDAGEWRWIGETLAKGITPTVLDDVPEGPPRYWPGARCPHGRWEMEAVPTFAEAKAQAQTMALALMTATTCVHCQAER
jgi:hypothetical protein